jgi:hypothetical protein
VETGLVIRSAGKTPPAAGKKPAVRDTVPASLSASQSVTAVAKSTEARGEDNSHVPMVVEAQNQQMISQALDAARQLAERPPDEAKQRLRAYVRRTPARGRSKSALDLEV